MYHLKPACLACNVQLQKLWNSCFCVCFLTYVKGKDETELYYSAVSYFGKIFNWKADVSNLIGNRILC